MKLLPQANADALALSDLERKLSFSQLNDRVSRLTHALKHQLELKPDDHIALLMHNRVEFVEVLLAAVLTGVWVTPINWHLSETEVRYILHDSGARVLLHDSSHRGVAERCFSGARLETETSYEDLLRRGVPRLDLAGPAGGAMIYTSGTSGRPKGVKRQRPTSAGAALEGFAQSGQALGLDGNGPHLVTGPMYHAAPVMFAIYDLMNGSPMLILPRWREEQALELLSSERVRHTHLVPTMFVRLLRLDPKLRASSDTSHLKLVLHGAAPISVGIKRQMIDWWGPILVEYWGATEGGVYTLVESRDWLSHPGTVGRALPKYEVFATDDEGARLPTGEVGVLCCRHKQLTEPFVYHRAPEKTAATYPQPGVFTVGDVGRIDNDGFVYLVDRKSSMIISGGVNIYPAETEQVLVDHPKVADVAVFGIPDDEWGESVKATIELVAGTEPSDELENELLTYARGRLAGYKVPRSIDFGPLPRLPTGKIQLKKLKAPYWGGREPPS